MEAMRRSKKMVLRNVGLSLGVYALMNIPFILSIEILDILLHKSVYLIARLLAKN